MSDESKDPRLISRDMTKAIGVEWVGAMEALGADRQELEAAFQGVQDRTVRALEHNDPQHAMLLRHEIPALLTEKLIKIRREERERVLASAGPVLQALYSLARYGVRRVVPLVLLLLVATSCALFQPVNTVPSAGVRGLVGNICDVVNAQCVEEKLTTVGPAECESLKALLVEKTVKGPDFQAHIATICAANAACLAAWPDLPAHRREDYGIWCDTLQRVGTQAVFE